MERPDLLPTDGFAVPGHQILRALSERETSKLFLARTGVGGLVALKIELPRVRDKTQVVLRRYDKLKELTKVEGFTPLLDYGLAKDGWVWHTMPLADNLPGLAPLSSESGLQHYTPLTLGAWTVEDGPALATQVAQWGKRISHALTCLHGAGLVHRDIKPSNLLFIGGQLALADYGLVGEPGSEFDFAGTEGFVPLEGTSDLAADLFALGKTLYEAWSGKDRLEYPSLPNGATEGKDWVDYGRALNEVILRSCHAHPSRRYQSAEDFSEAFEEVLSGRSRMPRRRWLAGVGALALLSVPGLVIYRHRPPATAHWRRVREMGFNVEAWQGHSGTVDWKRGKIYSISTLLTEFRLQAFDLRNFEIDVKALTPSPEDAVSSLLHPMTGRLWAVEGGRGEVYEIDVDNGTVRNLAGGPNPKLYHGAALYWNPVTGRVGSFGGYGNSSVRNSVHEFDEQAGLWLEIHLDSKSKQPWPRILTPGFIYEGAENTTVYLGCGNGSPSGKQGDRVQNLRGFNSQFHFLDDVWELNLRQNQWTEILPIGALPFTPQAVKAMVYHSRLRAIVLITVVNQDSPEGSRVLTWMIRPGVDRKPLKLRQQGEISRLGTAWSYALDPMNQELLMLADDGIFRVRFESP